MYDGQQKGLHEKEHVFEINILQKLFRKGCRGETSFKESINVFLYSSGSIFSTEKNNFEGWGFMLKPPSFSLLLSHLHVLLNPQEP